MRCSLTFAAIPLRNCPLLHHTWQVWPKVIEVIAPLLFYGMTPAAYLATQATYRSAFIIINFWFVAAEVAAWVLLKRNFIEEYLQDWNPKEVRQRGFKREGLTSRVQGFSSVQALYCEPVS